MKIYDFDAVVIGSGCAGYNCADWLYDLGYRNVAVMTERKNAGTSRNTGSDKQTYYKLSLAGDDGDSVLSMAKTLFEGGAMDGDVALCEAANSVKCFMKLANLGMEFPTNGFGEYVGYKTDHDPFCRATSIGPYTSKKMTEVLENAVLGKGITLLDRTQAIRLLVDGGSVTGVLAIDTSVKDRVEYVAVRTPYVVLATGGPAAIYADNVYPLSHTGNSSLALEAGATFGNLSEWQYGLASTKFRWNVSGTYQQVLPKYISIDQNGVEREFLRDYFSQPQEMLKNVFLKGYEWPFDVRKLHGSSYIDLLVYHESVILGRDVYMDFRQEPWGLENGFDCLDEVSRTYLKNSDALLPLPIERLRKMNPGAISLYLDHGIDLTREPLRVAVCAQHNNGGVRINANWQTDVKGLYAVGEVAGSLGIFRPGGTALNSCQVGSMRAAEHIVFEGTNKVSNRFEVLLNEAVNASNSLIASTRSDHSTLREKRREYATRMSRCFAFLRDISTMTQACLEISEDVQAFCRDNSWQEASEIPMLFKNLDIISMQEAVGAAMLACAKQYGSRGSAFVLEETDFMDRCPKEENVGGRSEIVTVQKKDGLTVERVSVRPIPERDLWFEKVWNHYNAIRGQKQ